MIPVQLTRVTEGGVTVTENVYLVEDVLNFRIGNDAGYSVSTGSIVNIRFVDDLADADVISLTERIAS